MTENKRKILMRYTLIGFLFGLMFPLMAYILEIFLKDLNISFNTIKKIHMENKLLYMIDTAPVFLGLFSLTGGISKAKSEAVGVKLKKILSEKEMTENELKDRDLLQKNVLKEIDYISENLYNNLSDISNSMKDIKSKEVHIKSNTSNVLNTTGKNVELSETIFNKSHKMNKEMNETMIGVNKTNDEIIGIIEALKNIEKMMGHQMNEMNKLLFHSERVAQVIDIINQISSQIHLLSLNASLEAAKAGALGKSFNVVANEVKKLAYKTDEATDEIEKVIYDMKKMVDLVFLDIRNINSVLEEKTLTAEEAQTKLTSMLTKFTNFQDTLEEMHDLIQLQQKGIKTIETETKNAHGLTEDMSSHLTNCNEAIDTNEKMIIQLKNQKFSITN